MAEENVPRTDVDMVTVLLVDDHPMFLDGLRGAFLPQDGFRVVGVATNAEDAVALSASAAPHVVVLDLGLPDGSGIEVTRRLIGDRADVKVLVLSMSDDDDNILAAMRAGAHGYLIKGADREEILTAMRTVARGGAVFSPRVALRLRAFFDSLAAAPGRSAFPELTPRELEILGLLAGGLTYRQISRELCISDKTVRNHITNIFAKLQVTDRAQAIVRARNAGLGAAAPPPQGNHG
ncbi:response regulator [Streptomyces sp. NPDC057620]|uniref:response regulator n=1 Tax=Streptomyces sp. NPDC057620 TaxID=3346185 RepID=UPI00369A73D4